MSFDTIINGVLGLDPSIIALLFGGAAGVSLLTQWAKKIFAMTNEKYIMAIFNIIALLASGLGYFLTSSNLPPTVLGVSTVVLTGIATPIYFWLIKPLSLFITNVNLYKARLLDKVEEVEKLVMPEAPATITSTTTVTTESSTTPATVTVDTPSTAPIADF
jgi:hypothetical protein